MADSPPNRTAKYRVVLSGAVLPEKSRREVLDNLASLFHSQRATMRKLLLGKPVPLTKEYEHDQAVKICRAIRDAGAECNIEEIDAPDASTTAEDAVTPGPAAEKSTPECPSCERAISLDHEQCPHCGFTLDRRPQQHAPDEEPSSAANTRQHDSPETDTGAAAEKESAAKESSEEETALMRFVAVNTDYYRRQFAKFGDVERPSFALSWHWPAFLAFFFWATYRKLWLWAGVNLAGGLVLALMVKPGIAHLVWALSWPLAANYLYFRHACNQIFGRAGAERAEGGRAGSGGVSRAAVWFSMIVIFLLSLALNNTITEQMLEQYAERSGETLPAPGTRQRGDGSVIEEGADHDPALAKTLTRLNIIAAALKIAASNKAPDDRQSALSVFKRTIEQKQVKDAWGTVISLRQDATGEVTLISAGPDRRFDTGDDILQYIRFDRL